MKLHLAILTVAFSLVTGASAGPDEEFADIVGIIRQGDQLVAEGKDRRAMEEYQRAQKALLGFEKVYPDWDRQVVTFRQRYLAERLGSWSATEGQKDTAVEEELRLARNRIIFLERASQQYQQQLSQLHAENNRLTAQLREALAIRPAAQEPAAVAQTLTELDSAREEIAGLEKRLAELEAELALLPDPEEARQTAAILKETQKNLTEALNVAEVLRRQNEALRSPTAAPRQEAGPQVDDVQKELLSTRVAMQVAQSELATLRGELAVLQLALAARGTNVADRPGSGRLRPVDDARLALANDRVPDAIRVLNAETASSPENAEAWYLLGRSLGLTGDLAGAERALARTLELAPGSAVTHFELARLHQRRNPNDHGIPRWHYHKAVSLGYPRDAAFEQAIQWEQPAGPK